MIEHKKHETGMRAPQSSVSVERQDEAGRSIRGLQSLADLSTRTIDPGASEAHEGAFRQVISTQAQAGARQVAQQSILRMQRTHGNRYVQRMLALARKADGEGEVAPEVEGAIENARGGGQSLDNSVRTKMETAFGVNFEGVRIHTDSRANELNRAVNALAFTTGSDIFFRSGMYQPTSSSGQELLAHELTHVVQQGGIRVQGKLVVGEPDDQYEQEADQIAKVVVAQDQSGFASSTDLNSAHSMQRKCECGGTCSSCRDGKGQNDEVGVVDDDDVFDETVPKYQLNPQALVRATVQRATIQRAPSIQSWTFSNSGGTSADNCCALCPITLGVGGPGGFTNGMQLQAFISNDETGASYDVKRVKERSTWQKVGGAWSNLTHLGPGADDDSHNDDECLTPGSQPPFLPYVYSIDTPGFNSTTGLDPTATDAVYKASFTESVKITSAVGGASVDANTFNWHSITWLTQSGGTWSLDAGRSEIRAGSVAVGTASP